MKIRNIHIKLMLWFEYNFKYLVLVSLMLLDVLLFLPIPCVMNGELCYNTLISIGIPDATIFTALMVGLFGFFATIYTNERNLKIMKLSVMPNTFQLKSNLEYEILFYRYFENLGVEDELSTFNRIFNLFLNNGPNFRLIAPKSYENILFKLLMFHSKELDEGLPAEKEASVKIVRSMGKLILIDESKILFSVKEVYSFDKFWDIAKCGGDYELNIRNMDVKSFIESINNDKIREETLILFDEIVILLKNFINLLESELNN